MPITFIERLRWRLADHLCRLATRLRGHEVVAVDYQIRGNEAAAIRDDLAAFAVSACLGPPSRPSTHEEVEKFKLVLNRLDRLAALADSTWWHKDGNWKIGDYL